MNINPQNRDCTPSRRCRFPYLCRAWAVFPTCYRNWVRHAWPMGPIPFSLSGSSLAGLSITDIPLGYGLFCSTYDFVVDNYLMISDTAWHESGKFDLYFWRHSP